MIVLGLILLIIGLVASISILTILGPDPHRRRPGAEPGPDRRHPPQGLLATPQSRRQSAVGTARPRLLVDGPGGRRRERIGSRPWRSTCTGPRAPTCWRRRSATSSPRPLDDPLAQEVVVVPARGVERWLTQRLSHRLGVGARGATACAPACGSSSRGRWSRCCSAATATTRGTPSASSGRCSPPSTPASASRGAPRWPPTSATAAPATTPSCAATAATAWRSGWRRCSRRTPPSGRPSSPTGARAATPTAPAATSTPTWPGSPSSGAALLTRVDAPPPTSATRRRSTALRAGGGRARPAAAAVAVRPHPAARHRGRAARRAGRAPRRPPLPPAGLPALWDALAGPRRRRRPRRRRARRELRRPPAARLARPRRPRAAPHPRRRRLPVGRRGRCRPAAEPADACSALLQHDLRANHAPTVEERAGRRHDPADRSLQVHACHGPSRQVDVLREVLVGLLQDDPTLEPRDILVMCPDIETYAPLISAGFGLASAGPEAPTGRGGRPPGPPAAGQARRPGPGQHQPAARRGRRAARAQRRPGDRLRGARPGRRRAVPAPVRVHRRRPRARRPLGGAHRHAVGARPATRGRRSRWTSSRRTPGAPASTGSCWASR